MKNVFRVLEEAVSIRNIIPENDKNYGEINLCDNPKGQKMLFRKGCKHAERVMNFSKASSSVMFACTASGHVLAPHVMYKAEHLMNTWIQGGPAWYKIQLYKVRVV